MNNIKKISGFTAIPLSGADMFLDIMDYDQKVSGLPGNIVQFIMRLDSMPDLALLGDRFSRRAHTWPSGLFLKKPFLGCRQWNLSSRRVNIEPVRHTLSGSIRSPDSIMDDIVNDPIDLARPPVFRLDVIELDNGGLLCFTWHHLLSDARGGEMLFRYLTAAPGTPAVSPSVSFPSDAGTAGVLANLSGAARFKPMVRRMSELGVKSPGSNRNAGNLRLCSMYHRFTREQSSIFSNGARKISPVFGETASLMAASLRAVHGLMPEDTRRSGGYVIPVPLSVRNAAHEIWMPGNRITICFVPVEAVMVDSLDFASLAGEIAVELREQVASGLPEAAEAAMRVARFFPKALYRKILIDTMNGEMSSFFFSNTGPVGIGGRTGELFEVAGAQVVSCFHRPMVSQPPGCGFFFSQYAGSLHLTVCWISEVLSKNFARRAITMICRDLAGAG